MVDDLDFAAANFAFAVCFVVVVEGFALVVGCHTEND